MVNKAITYLELGKTQDEIKRNSKIYDIHKYWSRKPWHPISDCIRKYSNEGDTVVDLFLGSGVTALESILINRNFKGFDLNPISIFISENTLKTDVDLEEFRNELKTIKEKIQPLSNKLYNSKKLCEICSNNLTIQHTNIGPKFRNKETAYLFCQECGKSKTKRIIPISKEDLLRPAKKCRIKKWIPKNKFPERFYKDRFSYKGIKTVNDMFTNRNLYFLSELHNVIRNSNLKYEKLFVLGFTNTLLHASKLKSENVRPLNVNNYWVPDDYFEENPWLRFLNRIEKIIKSKEILNERLNGAETGDFRLYNQSSLKTRLKADSVDYIITDPPYGDAIQYSELSYIWNSWINQKYNIKEEVIINPFQKKGFDEFLSFLSKSVKEARRILKKGKYYTLCFHNKEFKIWKGVLDLFKDNDFILESIEIVDTKGNSYNTNWSKFNPKTDIYLTFKKSKFKHTHKREYSIREILTDILNSNKKIKRTDTCRMYDLLVVKLIKEMYFNEYQIDISKLSIKEVAKIFKG